MISTESNIKTYNCDGAQTSFPIFFPYADGDTIKVYVLNTVTKVETELTSGVDFNIDDSNIITVSTYSADYQLVIVRILSILQNRDINNMRQAAVLVHVLEAAVDELTMVAQQHKEKLDRAVLFKQTSGESGHELPEPENEYFLRWLGGKLVNSKAFSSGLSIQTFMEVFLKTADKPAARTELDVYGKSDSRPADKVSLADAGARYAAIQVEAALQEIAGAGRTTETVKQNQDDIDDLTAFALQENLLGYWSFDEGAGAVAKDQSGHGNDGALEGTAPAWAVGKSGNCVDLPGANERVDCGNGAPLDDIGNGSFWISFWMKSKDTVPLNYGMLFTKTQNSDNRFELYSLGTDSQFAFILVKGGVFQDYIFSFNLDIFDATWRHIILVINRTTDKILCYVDTVKDATELNIDTLPADISNTGNVIWGSRATGLNPYEGLLDEGRIHQGLPTQAKIEYLFKHPSGTIPSFARKAGWYKFADPATGWKASKTTWATADDFDAGLEVTFSEVPAGAKAVRVLIYQSRTFSNVYYRKSGDANISNTPNATLEVSHQVGTEEDRAVLTPIWLSADYKAQFTVVNINTNLYIAYPAEYLL